MKNPKPQIPASAKAWAGRATGGRAHIVTVVLLLLVSSNGGAQAPPNATFEVASVRANRSGQPLQILPTLQPGGRVFAINLPLREFIQVAYGLRENQLILGAPLAEARFDLEARAGAGATPEQAAAMLRAFLSD